MKKWILPAVAAVAVIAAVLVLVIVPGKDGGSSVPSGPSGGNSQSDPDAVGSGDYLIKISELSSDKVSFIRPVTGSRIELLARIGDDGEPKVMLGTCQSCNGSPGAYYTQEGDQLKCNNCGLTFPLNVLDSPAGGCHPIKPDDSVFTVTDEGIVIHTDLLMQYEELFSKVADH